MKVISTDRIDSSIEVHRNRIILPQKVTITCGDTTVKAYTATIFDVEDLGDVNVCSLDDYYRTIDGALTVAKLNIDLAIAIYEARI